MRPVAGYELPVERRASPEERPTKWGHVQKQEYSPRRRPGQHKTAETKFVAVLARTCTSLGRAIEYFAAVLPSATNVPLPVARSDGLGWNPAVFVGDGPKRIRFLLVKSINKCAVSHASQSFPLVTERSTLAPDLAFARSSIIEAVQLAAIGPLVNLMQMFANFLLI